MIGRQRDRRTIRRGTSMPIRRGSDRVLLPITLCLWLASGCYYGHLAVGQTELLLARRGVADVLADPETSDELRERLLLVDRARSFASQLGLAVGGQYTSYVPWPGDRVLTTLVASEPGRVEARPFHFPIVGHVPYKGFFDIERAEAEAERLRAEGLDTCLIPVAAYSTLGWFDDPLTDPMLQGGDGRLVETVIHELVHSTVFLKNQPDFNEGVANFVGQEASVRFFADQPQRERERRAEVSDARRLAAEMLALREAVRDLYEREELPAERERQRRQIEADSRGRLADLPLETRDAAQLAQRVRLNDACLALRGTYSADTERHAELLGRLEGDLPRFIDRLRRVAEEDDPRTAFFADDGGPAGSATAR